MCIRDRYRLVHHQILSMYTFTPKHARTDTDTRTEGGNIRLKIASKKEKSDKETSRMHIID